MYWRANDKGEGNSQTHPSIKRKYAFNSSIERDIIYQNCWLYTPEHSTAPDVNKVHFHLCVWPFLFIPTAYIGRVLSTLYTQDLINLLTTRFSPISLAPPCIVYPAKILSLYELWKLLLWNILFFIKRIHNCWWKISILECILYIIIYKCPSITAATHQLLGLTIRGYILHQAGEERKSWVCV